RNALQMARQHNLHLISKLRYDAALYFPYTGPYAGRGPHRKYGRKVDYDNMPMQVVLENSNMAQLAPALYLLVHSLPQEDRYDTDDASAREIYSILVPESTLCTVQSLRHRPYCASLLDRQGQAHRTVALHPVPPGVLRAGGHLDGAEQAARSDCGT